MQKFPSILLLTLISTAACTHTPATVSNMGAQLPTAEAPVEFKREILLLPILIAHSPFIETYSASVWIKSLNQPISRIHTRFLKSRKKQPLDSPLFRRQHKQEPWL